MIRRTLQAPRSGGRPTFLRRALTLGAIGGALALAGCSTQSPVQTLVPYDAADGVPVDLGPVQLRDLVVISAGKDKPGVLSASMSNTSGSEQRVAFALPNASPVYATAPPHSQQRLSDTSQVQLASVPAAPGDVVTLTVQSPSAPAAVVSVPVLPANNYYATLGATAPATSTSTASPTTTATP